MDAHGYAYMDSLFLENYKALDQLSLYREQEPRVEAHEHAAILPFRDTPKGKCAGVVTHDGAFVELSSFGALSPVDSWGGAYPCDSMEVRHQRVMYLGRLWNHWGHFLMDLVSRLWYAIEREPNILIAYDGQGSINGAYADFFCLAGLRPEQFVQVTTPTRFDEVVVPECTHVPGRYVYPAFARIFDHVAQAALQRAPHATPYEGRRVYLTRTGIRKKLPTELGEKSIENLCSSNGFAVVSPEKLALEEQIVAIRQAAEVACLSGTLPHTMMFAKDGAKLTIFRKSNKPVYRQFSVDQVRKLDVTHVDAHFSPRPVGPSGPFVVTINDNVRRWAQDRDYVVPETPLTSSALRKMHALEYVPLYVARTHKRTYRTPLFIDGEFSSAPTAERELFSWYLHRL